MRIKAIAAICAACVFVVVRKRRKATASRRSQATLQDREPVIAAVHAQENGPPPSKPPAEELPRSKGSLFTFMKPDVYIIRSWQVLLVLLTFCGSIVNSVRFYARPELTGGLLAMGILQVGALEVFLRKSNKRTATANIMPQRSSPGPQASTSRRSSTTCGLDRLPYTPEQISGYWRKDRRRSDSMQRACDIMRLPGYMRQAIHLLKGSRILLTRDTFHVAAVSLVPAIRIAERYALTGEESRFRRRDQRRGGAWGKVELTEDGVVFSARWDAPLAGHTTEIFRLVNPKELHIETRMCVGGEACTYFTVYTKR